SDANLHNSYIGSTNLLRKEKHIDVPRLQHFHRPENFSYMQRKTYTLPYSTGMKKLLCTERKLVYRTENVFNKYKNYIDPVILSKFSDGYVPPTTKSIDTLNNFTDNQRFTRQKHKKVNNENYSISESIAGESETSNDINKLRMDIQIIKNMDNSLMAKELLNDLKIAEQNILRINPWKNSRSRSASRRPHQEPRFSRPCLGNYGNRSLQSLNKDKVTTRSTDSSTTTNFYGSFEMIAIPKSQRSFKYGDLRTDRNTVIQPGIIRNKLERYLNDEDFQLVFGISREDFYRLPKWKQNYAKKESYLF
ncbi:hypothetical protein GJ496_010515, partial [Pomphorhynchus laevis]